MRRAVATRTFGHTAVSRLEKIDDMKLSTLIEYLHGIGMGLEISVYTKGSPKGRRKKEILLQA